MEDYTKTTETTLRDYTRVLFRHKAVIITTFITVMATVFIGLKLKTPVYEASVKMLISAKKQVEATYYRELAASRNAEIVITQSDIVKSRPVIERAVRATGLYGRPLDYEKEFSSPFKKGIIDFNTARLKKKLAPLSEEQKKAYLFRRAVDELQKNVKVEPIRDTNLFTISARDFSPLGAAIIANVISRSYVIFDLEQQLAELELKYGEKHLSVRQMKDSIEKMEKRLTGNPLSNIEAIGPASVKIIEQAQIPLSPTGTPKILTLALAFVMSIFLGIMLAFVFEYMDQTLKSPRDVETFLNLPFLGSIPKKKALKKEALHTLSEQIYLLMKDKSLKTLLLAAALPKEGTTTIIGNLARHLSDEMKHKILIIDANLRNPGIDKMFNLEKPVGLSDVLEGKTDLPKVIRNMNNNLSVLPAGQTTLNPITLLDSSIMREVIKTAKKDYEIVLIDCANLNNFKDGEVISSSVDAIALIINEGRTRRQVIENAIAPLQEKKSNIIGAILNNRAFPIPKGIYERV